jgi:hypothetical protein
MAKRTPERKENRRAVRATRKLAKNERKLEREKTRQDVSGIASVADGVEKTSGG